MLETRKALKNFTAHFSSSMIIESNLKNAIKQHSKFDIRHQQGTSIHQQLQLFMKGCNNNTEGDLRNKRKELLHFQKQEKAFSENPQRYHMPNPM